MASSAPNNGTSSSPPQETSSTANPPRSSNDDSEDGPKTRGPIRLLSMNGKLTELGKRVERERLAKLAAEGNGTATSDDDAGEGKHVADSAGKSSS